MKNKKDLNREESDIDNKLNLSLTTFKIQFSLFKEKLESKFKTMEEDIKQLKSENKLKNKQKLFP